MFYDEGRNNLIRIAALRNAVDSAGMSRERNNKITWLGSIPYSLAVFLFYYYFFNLRISSLVRYYVEERLIGVNELAEFTT